MTTYQTPTMTLPSWTARYLDVRQGELAKKTMDIHRNVSEQLVEFFGKININDIKRSHATDWRMWLKSNKGLAESTTCKYCRTAKVIFNRAIDDEFIDRNPFARLKVTPPKKDIFSRRLIKEDEVQKVMQASEEIRPIVALCYYAGLRTAEAIHLKSADIAGLDRIYIRPREGRVTTKQRYREVRQESELRSMFTYHDGSACGLLESGRQDMVWELLHKACDRAGVEPFTFQQLRQARDTEWRKSFAPYIVCAWLGHSEQVARENYVTIDESAYDSAPTKENQ